MLNRQMQSERQKLGEELKKLPGDQYTLYGEALINGTQAPHYGGPDRVLWAASLLTERLPGDPAQEAHDCERLRGFLARR